MSRRTLLIVTFVSLALNLFLIGGLVGAGMMGLRPPPPRPEGRAGPGMTAAASALEPEQREAWRAMLREQAKVSGPQLREARAARRGALRRIAEEPMDTQAILADLARSRTIEQGARTEMDRRTVEFAASLPLADRVRMSEALNRRGPGRERRGGRPSGGRGPGADVGDREAGLPDR